MKTIITKILLIISTFSIMGMSVAYATNYQAPTIPKPYTLTGPTGDVRNTLTKNVLPKLAVGTIGIVGALALLFLIIAGVRFAMVYGNEEAAQTAKKQVIFSIVGLLIALLAYTMVNILTNIKFEGDTTQKPIVKPNDAQLEDKNSPIAPTKALDTSPQDTAPSNEVS